MAEEENNKAEEKLEEKKKSETSVINNISPITIIIFIGVILIAYFSLDLTQGEWILLIAILAFIIWVLAIRTKPAGQYLTEEEAKELLKLKLDKKKETGEIPQNNRISIGLVSACPHIDGVQREYFLPFSLIDENNIPKEWLARMDRVSGNATFAKCPEGFNGDEKPTIRHVLDKEMAMMKKMGLDKGIWSKLLLGR